MNPFRLDERLRNDCFDLGSAGFCRLLLLDNSLVPWFILVPQRKETELIQLPFEEQVSILRLVNTLGTFVKNSFEVSKLNIATIGNVVSQLHIHVIGRHNGDYCWPEVVWGRAEKQKYSSDEVASIREKLLNEQILTK